MGAPFSETTVKRCCLGDVRGEVAAEVDDVAQPDDAAVEVTIAGVEGVGRGADRPAVLLDRHQPEVCVRQKLERLEAEVEGVAGAVPELEVGGVGHDRRDDLVVPGPDRGGEDLGRGGRAYEVALEGHRVVGLEVAFDQLCLYDFARRTSRGRRCPCPMNSGTCSRCSPSIYNSARIYFKF